MQVRDAGDGGLHYPTGEQTGVICMKPDSASLEF